MKGRRLCRCPAHSFSLREKIVSHFRDSRKASILFEHASVILTVKAEFGVWVSVVSTITTSPS